MHSESQGVVCGIAAARPKDHFGDSHAMPPAALLLPLQGTHTASCSSVLFALLWLEHCERRFCSLPPGFVAAASTCSLTFHRRSVVLATVAVLLLAFCALVSCSMLRFERWCQTEFIGAVWLKD